MVCLFDDAPGTFLTLQDPCEYAEGLGGQDNGVEPSPQDLSECLEAFGGCLAISHQLLRRHALLSFQSTIRVAEHVERFGNADGHEPQRGIHQAHHPRGLLGG